MPWDGIRKRAEDSGQEGPEVILARIDERLKNYVETFANHVHSNKNDFAEVRNRIEIENTKIKKEIFDNNKEVKNDIKWLLRYAYIAMGAVVIINIFFVPIMVQHLVKRINTEFGLFRTHERIS